MPSASTQPVDPSGRINLGQAGYSLSWLGNDRILSYDAKGLATVDVNTHERKMVLTVSSDVTRLESLAVVSPDGTRIAFSRRPDLETPPVLQVLRVGDREPRSITPAHEGPYGVDVPVWSPDGAQLAYLDRNRSMAYTVPADGGAEPRPLPPDFVGYEFHAVVDWGRDRLLVVAGAGSATGLFTVPVGGGPPVRVDAEGRPKPGDAVSPIGFSPDGTKIAYARPDGGLWLAAANGSWRREVNADLGPLNRGRLLASFAPDGRLAFAVEERLWVAEPDGSKAVPLMEAGCQTPTFSPDGSKVACFYSEEDASGGHTTWVSIVEASAAST